MYYLVILFLLTGCAAQQQAAEEDEAAYNAKRDQVTECMAKETLAVARQPVDLETASLAVLTRCEYGRDIDLDASTAMEDSDPFGRAHVWTLKVGDVASCGQMYVQQRAGELVTSVAQVLAGRSKVHLSSAPRALHNVHLRAPSPSSAGWFD
jgi:hypothetical protein